MVNGFDKISLVSKNYADALISIAREGRVSFEMLTNDVNTVSRAFEESEDFRRAMLNPVVNVDVKVDIINSVFGGKICNELINFLKILAEKKRLGEFEQIKTAYMQELDKINNIQPVTVVSAIELSDEKKRLVVEKLRQKLNKEVRPLWHVDGEILAGLVFKIDDNVVDMSLNNRVDKLSKNLK